MADIQKNISSAADGRDPGRRINRKGRIAFMAKIAVLGAISIIIMLFEFPLPFAPPFYKLDLSEAVILIGGFALGPLAGVAIEFLKIMLNFLINGTLTFGVGELANFIMGCSLVVPAAWIYKRKKTLKNAIIGMAVGTSSLTVIGSLLNLFALLPVYSLAYGMPIEALVEMGSKVNGLISNLATFVLFATAPFNLIKGIACSLLASLLYKHISPILHKQLSH